MNTIKDKIIDILSYTDTSANKLSNILNAFYEKYKNDFEYEIALQNAKKDFCDLFNKKDNDSLINNTFFQDIIIDILVDIYGQHINTHGTYIVNSFNNYFNTSFFKYYEDDDNYNTVLGLINDSMIENIDNIFGKKISLLKYFNHLTSNSEIYTTTIKNLVDIIFSDKTTTSNYKINGTLSNKLGNNIKVSFNNTLKLEKKNLDKNSYIIGKKDDNKIILFYIHSNIDLNGHGIDSSSSTITLKTDKDYNYDEDFRKFTIIFPTIDIEKISDKLFNIYLEKDKDNKIDELLSDLNHYIDKLPDDIKKAIKNWKVTI